MNKDYQLYKVVVFYGSLHSQTTNQLDPVSYSSLTSRTHVDCIIEMTDCFIGGCADGCRVQILQVHTLLLIPCVQPSTITRVDLSEECTVVS